MILSLPIAASYPTPFHNPTLWVAVALFLFIGLLLWKGVFAMIGKALDERAAKIKTDLDEAKRLREEAQALLASYQRKQKEAEEQAEEIVVKARRDAEAMADKARKDLVERLERRAAQAEAKIASAEAQALAEVKAKAANMAVETAQKLIADNISATNHTSLVKEGIKGLAKN